MRALDSCDLRSHSDRYNPAGAAGPAQPSKRNILRACDLCRTKKIKCDGPKMPNHFCTGCRQVSRPCTYVEASKPRGPPKAYVTGLEDRLEELEELLSQLRPDSDFSEVLGPPVIRGSWQTDHPSNPSNRRKQRSSSATPKLSLPSTFNRDSTHLIFPSTSGLQRNAASEPPVRTQHSDSEYEYSSDDSDDVVMDNMACTERLILRDTPIQDPGGAMLRFYGHSSSSKLVNDTKRLRHQHIMSTSDNSSESGNSSMSSASTSSTSWQRPSFWRAPPWEILWEGIALNTPTFMNTILVQFPPADLAEDLIALYFDHVEAVYPLLHRPMFLRQWNDKLHHTNIWYAALCLGIFAVASRMSEDSRVLPESDSATEGMELNWHTAGQQYFNAVLGIHRTCRALLYPVSLFEVQTFPLMANFLRGTSDHAYAWILTGVGMQKLMDCGAHRRSVYSKQPNLNEELWKRVFWGILAADRISSVSLGRNMSIGEEDYDVDYPLEVDDEYWESDSPKTTPVQLLHIPSALTAFNLWCRLTQIIAFALRTIYVTDPSAMFLGLLSPRPTDVLAQLTKALSDWHESVPHHLRWKNQIDKLEVDCFTYQAASLTLTYHLVQILVYRPFVRQLMGRLAYTSGGSSLPSLALCVETARAPLDIVRAHLKSDRPLLWNIHSVTALSVHAVAILLVKVWELKREESARRATAMMDLVKPLVVQEIDGLMDDIAVYLQLLEWASKRYEMWAPMLEALQGSMPNSDEEIDRQHALNFEQTHAQLSRGDGMFLGTRMHSQSQHNLPLWNCEDVPLSRHSRGVSLHTPPPVIDLNDELNHLHTFGDTDPSIHRDPSAAGCDWDPVLKPPTLEPFDCRREHQSHNYSSNYSPININMHIPLVPLVPLSQKTPQTMPPEGDPYGSDASDSPGSLHWNRLQPTYQ